MTAKKPLPLGWVETKFGKIAKFKNGANFSASDRGVELKMLGVGDFQDKVSLKDTIDLKSVHLNSQPSKDNFLEAEDLVFVRSNGSKELVGRCLHIECIPKLLIYSGFCIRARIHSVLTTSRYVSLLMQKGILKRQLVKDGRGTNISNLNQGILDKLTLVIPPLPEQKAIADLLSSWDEAIEKTERLIQAKEANLKGQIQKLISQRCDSWSHVKPKKMFDTITEKNFPEEELLSVTQDRGVIPRSMLEGRVMSPDGTTASYKLIKQGDFAISLRSFQGGIEYSNYQGIISLAYTVLRPKMELNSDFYRLFFKSYIFIEKYLNLAVIGIRDGKQISIPDFLSIKIPVPPLEEQKEIAETLSICQYEIDLLKQLADKYKTQKRGLMQKMLTGEWRVKPEIVKTFEE